MQNIQKKIVNCNVSGIKHGRLSVIYIAEDI